MEAQEFRPLRRTTKGAAFGNRKPLKRFDRNFLRLYMKLLPRDFSFSFYFSLSATYLAAVRRPPPFFGIEGFRFGGAYAILTVYKLFAAWIFSNKEMQYGGYSFGAPRQAQRK